MSSHGRKLNWIRHNEFKSLHVALDYHPDYGKALALVPAITHLDLRKTICPPIVDQGQEGSCTFNAWAYLLGGLQLKDEREKKKSALEFDPSKFNAFARQFGYYGERSIMGTVNQDSGATLSVGLQAMQKWGCCREVTWPYSSPMTAKPSPEAYAEAALHKQLMGYRLDNTDLAQLKACLVAGYPFVFGIEVFASFFKTSADGFVAMPNSSDPSDPYEGGHALSCFGFNDHVNGGSFIVPNSWGADWADHGFCYIPYSFLTNPNLASDFLTARG